VTVAVGDETSGGAAGSPTLQATNTTAAGSTHSAFTEASITGQLGAARRPVIRP
jgi:hypothetical protein